MKKEKSGIQGLYLSRDPEEDYIYYYNDKMLDENLLILVEYDDSGESEWSISIYIYYLGKDDAKLLAMYRGDTLNNIEVYRIIKDIYEIYNENSLENFLDIIRNLSEESLSASTQSDKMYALEVKKVITFQIMRVKELI